MYGSKIFKLGPHWHGFRSVTRFMIFGDSYTDIGFQTGPFKPKPDHPLGVAYPGTPWTEDGKPNWVGHLITKYCPHPRYNPSLEKQSQEYQEHPLLIYNYAKGGDRVNGVATQIQRLFLPKVGQKPEWAAWDADNSLFLTWVGINDCASFGQHDDNIETLFELQEELYSTGARNFLFIDVPPVHKGAMANFMRTPERYGETKDNWNGLLQKAMEVFVTAHSDATVLFFSSSETFTKLMDKPSLYGFSPEAVQEFGGTMWRDHVHPTSRVHDLLASDIAEFLNGA